MKFVFSVECEEGQMIDKQSLESYISIYAEESTNLLRK